MNPLVVRRRLPLFVGASAWLLGIAALLGYWAWTPGVLIDGYSPALAAWVMLPLGAAGVVVAAVLAQPKPWLLRALVSGLCVAAAAVCCWLFCVLAFVAAIAL